MTTDTPRLGRLGSIGVAVLAVLAVVVGGTAVTAQEGDGGQPTVDLVAVDPAADGTSDTFAVVAENVSGVGAYEYTVRVEGDEPGTVEELVPGGNPPEFFTTVEYRDGDTTAFARVVGAETNDSGPVSIGTLTFSEAVEREDLSLSVAALGDAEGESYDVRVDEPTESAYYQVDFVAGSPIVDLGENGTYSEQARLLAYLHGSTEEPVSRVGGPIADENLTQCVSVESVDVGDDRAVVAFTVAADCEETLSLASYETPDAGWNASAASEQVLFDTAEGRFGPGNHTLAVELPGDPGASMDDSETDAGDGEETTETASVDARYLHQTRF
ncbi:hypothetical protein [Halomarina rubra]|uniref:Uncharacterized protein n=1 Tax=Halomarina rubra TaxID=2071873 RepID=A0ABD6AZG8_9EURY|nr:hypothetical protein [Halomarina rubra]